MLVQTSSIETNLFQCFFFFCRTTGSFQKSLQPLIVFAQFSGIPLFTFHDKFVALKIIYSSIVIISIFFMIFPLLIDPIIESSVYERVVAVIFYVDCFMIAIIFGYISTKISRLLESWKNFEFTNRDESGFRESQKFVIIFMSLAFCEHLLSKIVVYRDADVKVRLKNENGISMFQAFLTFINKSFFEIFPFSSAAGIYVILSCFYSTILWNFADCFLITIYLTITSKLKDFNKKIRESTQRYDDDSFWFASRNNFVALHEQIKLTNFIISPLVMITVLNDFYFICHQLLGAFK